MNLRRSEWVTHWRRELDVESASFIWRSLGTINSGDPDRDVLDIRKQLHATRGEVFMIPFDRFRFADESVAGNVKGTT